MIFKNSKIYDILNRVWKYAIPAIGFLWEVLYIVWKIPYGQQIYFTIAGVWGALAVFLGFSKYRFKKSATELFIEDNGGVEDENGN